MPSSAHKQNSERKRAAELALYLVLPGQTAVEGATAPGYGAARMDVSPVSAVCLTAVSECWGLGRTGLLPILKLAE